MKFNFENIGEKLDSTKKKIVLGATLMLVSLTGFSQEKEQGTKTPHNIESVAKYHEKQAVVTYEEISKSEAERVTLKAFERLMTGVLIELDQENIPVRLETKALSFLGSAHDLGIDLEGELTNVFNLMKEHSDLGVYAFSNLDHLTDNVKGLDVAPELRNDNLNEITIPSIAISYDKEKAQLGAYDVLLKEYIAYIQTSTNEEGDLVLLKEDAKRFFSELPQLIEKQGEKYKSIFAENYTLPTNDLSYDMEKSPLQTEDAETLESSQKFLNKNFPSGEVSFFFNPKRYLAGTTDLTLDVEAFSAIRSNSRVESISFVPEKSGGLRDQVREYTDRHGNRIVEFSSRENPNNKAYQITPRLILDQNPQGLNKYQVVHAELPDGKEMKDIFLYEQKALKPIMTIEQDDENIAIFTDREVFTQPELEKLNDYSPAILEGIQSAENIFDLNEKDKLYNVFLRENAQASASINKNGDNVMFMNLALAENLDLRHIKISSQHEVFHSIKEKLQIEGLHLEKLLGEIKEQQIDISFLNEQNFLEMKLGGHASDNPHELFASSLNALVTSYEESSETQIQQKAPYENWRLKEIMEKGSPQERNVLKQVISALQKDLKGTNGSVVKILGDAQLVMNSFE